MDQSQEGDVKIQFHEVTSVSSRVITASELLRNHLQPWGGEVAPRIVVTKRDSIHSHTALEQASEQTAEL